MPKNLGVKDKDIRRNADKPLILKVFQDRVIISDVYHFWECQKCRQDLTGKAC